MIWLISALPSTCGVALLVDGDDFDDILAFLEVELVVVREVDEVVKSGIREILLSVVKGLSSRC